MSDELPRPREWLAGAKPYRTQSQPADVRLQSNEWAEPITLGRYLTAADLETTVLNRYPDIAAGRLRTALAAEWDVAPEQVIVGNGSNEVLLYTFLIFGGPDRTLLVVTPTYTMYARLGRTTGMRVHEERVGVPYALAPATVREAIDRVRPDLICFSSPNNPTGDLIDDAVILSALESRRTLVLVDEAYADFAGHTVLPLIASHPNLVVARTFSKARASAGLRLGALVSDRRIADIYDGARLPYNVGALTQLVAERVASDRAGLAERVVCVTRERDRVFEALESLSGIDVFASRANFLLFRHRSKRATAVHADLLARGVLVRDVSSWSDAGETLRVTIGTPAENDRFLDALRATLEGR